MIRHSKYGTSLIQFYEYLQTQIKNHLTMGIGFSVVNPLDTERNLYYDIKLSDYGLENNEFNEYLEKTYDELNSSYIFNYDFNSFCVISNGIIKKFNDIDKIKTIVFDSSTFKFLNNIKFIGVLYYFTLEQNGEIYIESNSPFSHGFLIEKLHKLYKYINENNDGFKIQSAFAISDYLLNSVPLSEIEEYKKHIWSREQIYSHNVEYLQKYLYGSKVELIEDEFYPVTNPRYPIKKYYKIIKTLPHEEILKELQRNLKYFDNGLGLKTYSLVKLSEFK